MQLPKMLADSDDSNAAGSLRRYYGISPHNNLRPFTGAHFDAWDTTHSRGCDAHRFTADDLVAVSLLSVPIPPNAAIQLLETRAPEFTKLLRELGDDRDLVDEVQPWSVDWSGWQLWNALLSLPEVGPTTASKLFARKRPRLRPIYDSVVARVIDSQNIWEPMRQLLTEQPELHLRLIDLRAKAGVRDSVSALRIFDVVAWMEGKYGYDATWSDV